MLFYSYMYTYSDTRVNIYVCFHTHTHTGRDSRFISVSTTSQARCGHGPSSLRQRLQTSASTACPDRSSDRRPP